ncbi:four helix bundle protein [Treponema primitia]|uniref:four helix bundle protein n=1 Tax=Treponema primitia TaxID=88058 RepID=UPI00025554B0|nr:four helix bundle protein [Treponema primitia]
MDNNATKTKSRQFAVKIIQLYKHLSNNKKEYVLSEQLLRSGTGIGANLVEAECATNKNEFLAKIQEALQKCAETRYWLEILSESGFITEFEFKNCIEGCDELRKILFYTIKNLKAAPVSPAKNVSRETQKPGL